MHQIVCDPAGGAFLQRSPRPPSWILGCLLLREGRGPLLSRYTPIHYIPDKGLLTMENTFQVLLQMRSAVQEQSPSTDFYSHSLVDLDL